MLFPLVLLRQLLHIRTSKQSHAIFCRNTLKMRCRFVFTPKNVLSELLNFCTSELLIKNSPGWNECPVGGCCQWRIGCHHACSVVESIVQSSMKRSMPLLVNFSSNSSDNSTL